MTKLRLDVNCSMCGAKITFGTTHVRLDIKMMNGKRTMQRLCQNCCKKPDTTIVLLDVIEHPVQAILVNKVWS